VYIWNFMPQIAMLWKWCVLHVHNCISFPFQHGTYRSHQTISINQEHALVMIHFDPQCLLNPQSKSIVQCIFSSLLLHQVWDSVVSTETRHRIDGPGLEAGGVKGFFCSPNSIQTRQCTCRPIYIKGISWQCSTQYRNRINFGLWFRDSDTV